MEPIEAVLDANGRYYGAFEAGDLDGMSSVWEHSERATCTHPGWVTLRGWASVAASYFALLQQGQPLQFLLTQVRPAATGDVGWVSLDENLLGPADGGVTIAALNVFVRHPEGWKMVCHHGSAVAAVLEPGP